MRVLTGDAIDNIFDQMYEEDFWKRIENIYEETCDERVYVENALFHKFIFHENYVTVEMTVYTRVPYVNDRSNFIYEIDVDYNGEML